MTESFLPTLNGVTTSVCKVARCLRDLGHQVRIIAPGPGPSTYEGMTVHGLPSVPVRRFPTGVPTPALRRAIDTGVFLSPADPFMFGFERILDGLEAYIDRLAKGGTRAATPGWATLDDAEVSSDKRYREAQKAVRDAEKALRAAQRHLRQTLREARELFERQYLEAQLLRFCGNISRTANFVGMERSALHRKLKFLGVSADERANASVGA